MHVKGYDSKWERSLHKGVLSDCDYHSCPIEYSVCHTYEPDFVKISGDKVYLIEAKGRFRNSAEASKYKWVEKQLKSYMELVFLFPRPFLPMPHAKRRKNGTKLSHGEWASKNGFRWFTEESIDSLGT